MTSFESKAVINTTSEPIYSFLSDFNNHGQLMPDNVQYWSAGYNDASFIVQNTIKLSLQITERIENKIVNITAINNPPFPIQLNWLLEINGESTNVTFNINAEPSGLMKMMVAGPLQRLVDHEVSTLAKLFAA